MRWVVFEKGGFDGVSEEVLGRGVWGSGRRGLGWELRKGGGRGALMV